MSLPWPLAIPVGDDTFSIRGGMITAGATFYIAISFIIIAYVLHPFVGYALRRVRAHRAWRAIQQDRKVEVTQYSEASEILGSRGVWSCDAARMAVFLLSFFTLSSGLLELSLGICYYGTDFPPGKKWVDLLDRPPPVYHNDTHWLVPFQPSFCSENTAGYLENFEEYKMEGDVEDVDIYIQGKATSLYHIYPNKSSEKDSCCRKPDSNRDLVRGNIVIARWSNNVTNGLHYNESVGVDELSCDKSDSGNAGWPKSVLFANDTTTASVSCATSTTCEEGTSSGIWSIPEWGKVLVRDQGPKMFDTTSKTSTTPTGTDSNDTRRIDSPSPPVILLCPHGESSDIFMIVEETSDFFPFFYSVWMRGKNNDNGEELRFQFYVESRSRLVEAIVTAIVLYYREGDKLLSMDGGGRCLDLVTDFSNNFEDHDVYGKCSEALSSFEAGSESPTEAARARPFGENPTSSHKVVHDLFEVEPIEYGVAVDIISVVCGPCLVVLLIVSALWCLLVRSRIDIDVYDRDELIKFACLNTRTIDEIKSIVRIKIYVWRRKENGQLRVECVPVERTDDAGWTTWMRELLCLNPRQAQYERASTPIGGSGPAIGEEDNPWRHRGQPSPRSFRFARARAIPLPRDVRQVMERGVGLESPSPLRAPSPAGSSASDLSTSDVVSGDYPRSNIFAPFLLQGENIEPTERGEQIRPEWMQTHASELPPRAPRNRGGRGTG